MLDIVPAEDCVGCHSCESVCKADAIYMAMNDEGFIYPQLDKAKCFQCKECLGACPALAEKTFERLVAPDVYAAWSNNGDTRKISSSGGIFTELALEMLANGGAVYGAAFGKNFKLCHQMADSVAALRSLRGSKYVQSDLAGTFVNVQKLLKENQSVLFVGTPCQIAGLNSFLRNDYSRLITCDIICHGVASPGVFAKHIVDLENRYLANVIGFQFRSKPHGWREFFFDIRFDNGKRILKPFHRDQFMKGFLADIYLRPSCYQCKYSRVPRVADITLGDFWGIWDFRPEWDDNAGTTALLINSGKGRVFLSGLVDLALHPAKMEWVLKGNPSLVCSAKPHKNRKKFFQLFVKGIPFETIIDRCLPPPSYLDRVIWSINRRLKRTRQ